MTGNFIVRSKQNPKLILCTNGEFKPESMVGPGGYCAKVFKTRKGAANGRPGTTVIVEEQTQPEIDGYSLLVDHLIQGKK